MEQLYYMIIDTYSGQWIPDSKKRNKTSAELTITEPPRLFKDKSHATQAAQWWKDGIWYYSRNYDGHDLDRRKVPAREKVTLEVIPVSLIFNNL